MSTGVEMPGLRHSLERTIARLMRYPSNFYALWRDSQSRSDASGRAAAESICMFDRVEVPSDDEVVKALASLNGVATARALCAKLVEAGHPRLASQLAIQRAAERGRIGIRDDWQLTAEAELAA
jgi:hypothetical protein